MHLPDKGTAIACLFKELQTKKATLQTEWPFPATILMSVQQMGIGRIEQ